MFKRKDIQETRLNFLMSAMHKGCCISTEDVLVWMRKQNEEVQTEINQIPISELRGWKYRDDRIRHDSGRFLVSMEFIYRRTIVMYLHGINRL